MPSAKWYITTLSALAALDTLELPPYNAYPVLVKYHLEGRKASRDFKKSPINALENYSHPTLIHTRRFTKTSQQIFYLFFIISPTTVLIDDIRVWIVLKNLF
jgi:hypothetical protein